MIYTLYAFGAWVLLQPGLPTGASVDSASVEVTKSAQRAAGCNDPVFLGSMLLMIGVFYFMILRPQQKRLKEQESMQASLEKGSKVWTSGGIHGEVVGISDSEVQLVIADKTRIKVLRSHIATVLSDSNTK